MPTSKMSENSDRQTTFRSDRANKMTNKITSFHAFRPETRRDSEIMANCDTETTPDAHRTFQRADQDEKSTAVQKDLSKFLRASNAAYY